MSHDDDGNLAMRPLKRIHCLRRKKERKSEHREIEHYRAAMERKNESGRANKKGEVERKKGEGWLMDIQSRDNRKVFVGLCFSAKWKLRE